MVGSIADDDSKELFEVLLAKKTFSPDQISYRAHQGCRYQPPDSVEILSGDEPLVEQVGCFEVVIVSAITNAALDVALTCDKPLFFESQSSVNFGPLVGLNVRMFHDAGTLQALLKDCRNDKVKPIHKSQFFYFNEVPTLWRQAVRKALKGK